MRRWLTPFSFLYGIAVHLRNRAFDLGILHQSRFGLPVIVVGNISAGGTGKSPLVMYLAKLLSDKCRLAILSRGYGRKTSGYLKVSSSNTAKEVGDEPLQYVSLFSNVDVAVCEKRTVGIQRLLSLNPAPDVILLDDAYQHRYVKPGLSLLLTEYDAPFYQDLLLPAGRLREPSSAAGRADAIVVTKCPAGLSESAAKSMAERLRSNPGQPVFFSCLEYAMPVSAGKDFKEVDARLGEYNVWMFCGIARPGYLVNYLSEHAQKLGYDLFPDHHNYSNNELSEIITRFGRFSADNSSSNSLLLTTRKDFMRLINTGSLNLFTGLPLYILDVETVFLSFAWNDFDRFVMNYIQKSTKEESSSVR